MIYEKDVYVKNHWRALKNSGMAVDADYCELVSSPKSLLAGKFAGNSTEFGRFLSSLTQNNPTKIGGYGQFPYSGDQGILGCRAGN